MVLLFIAIAVGVLILTILIVKYFKTNPTEVLGMDMKCKRCGMKITGTYCPKCEKDKKTFGV